MNAEQEKLLFLQHPEVLLKIPLGRAVKNVIA